MPNPNPPDGDEATASDAGFRHAPLAGLSGLPQSAQASDEAPGIGASGWSDAGASPVLKGEAVAGGVDADHPHLFHLAGAPASVFPGGGLQGAHEGNFPILKGQFGAVYIARLAPGGVREPHWHPSAWEMNFVMQGSAKWTFVGPNATQDTFTAVKGDLVFAPQGHFHYFENAGETEDLVVLIVFNASAEEPDDDLGIVHSLSAMPVDVLAAVWGVDPSVFDALPKKLKRVVIASKKGSSP